MDRETLLRRVQAEHAALRKHLELLDALARQLENDESRLVGSLRSRLEAFRDEFRELLAWEQRDVAPLLAPEDVLCRVRLLADGLEVSRVLDAFEAQTFPPQILARCLSDLIDRVRQDVEREEQRLLNRRRDKARIGVSSSTRT